jgi:hypothetical protein
VKRTAAFLSAAGIGAALMYIADPAIGRRRRALTRDTFVHGARVVRRSINIAARDTAHRAKGLFQNAKGMFEQEDVSDDVLTDRVRAEIGRVSSHPNVEAIVKDSVVTLLGPVVARESSAILKAVRSVRGVQGVVDRMEAYEPTAKMQTQASRARQWDVFQKHWAPATRVAAGSIGASLLLASTKMSTAGRTLLQLGGLALLIRAATNSEFKHLFRRASDAASNVTRKIAA